VGGGGWGENVRFTEHSYAGASVLWFSEKIVGSRNGEALHRRSGSSTIEMLPGDCILHENRRSLAGEIDKRTAKEDGKKDN